MPDVFIGPQICRDFSDAISREWLITNGLGGFASGTVSGANSRAYHGLLVASLRPPEQRVVLLAALNESILDGDGEPQFLSAHEFWDGTVFPDGFRRLDEVVLEGMRPVFRWTSLNRTIEKRIWMEEGVNRTVITYRLLRGGPVLLRLQPLFAHRDFGGSRHGADAFSTTEIPGGWRVEGGGLTSHLQARPFPNLENRPDWYWRFLHRVERERGLDAEEDLFTPGTMELPIGGEPVALVIGTAPLPDGWSPAASHEAAVARDEAALTAAGVRGLSSTRLRRQLVAAAGQFRVARGSPGAGNQRIVIAGYHWFADWGRDTMISLPGLALACGRPDEARQILRTFVSFLDQGMLPNVVADAGSAEAYNTMDATLWLFIAVEAYLRRSADWTLVADILDPLVSVIDWHVRGTRYGIRMDEHDGLLAGGEPGVALTWMDARVDDTPITPRTGKPVEINALWYNALRLLAEWLRRAGRPCLAYEEMAARARESARARYWYPAGGYLLDVLDGPDGDDHSLRPNQLLALGLVHPLIEGEAARRALTVVTEDLLTPRGLRTLSPRDPRYRARYEGHQRARDAAYHMGTVWPWLLGPYLDAHWLIHRDRAERRRCLRAFDAHLDEAGLGTVSEIFEPEPPHRPVGCIAQAWSVAELARHALRGAPAPGPDVTCR